MSFNIDIKEEMWSTNVLNNLLIDRTTNRNIIWATKDYEKYGIDYNKNYYIEAELIIGDNCNVIQPRILKSKKNQTIRTKDKAEVFTPSWICNEQNNLVDDEWFKRKNVFNIPTCKDWITHTKKIEFPMGKRWQEYVDELRLEVSCGEAPYLVSRYDTVTGEKIKIKERIGLLDRKIRIVNENILDEKEWIKWVIRAFQSIYGFEFQGDNLLLARENLLVSFCEYLEERWERKAQEDELELVSEIISWNIWQMDGLTFTVPCHQEKKINEQLSFFDNFEEEQVPIYCMLKDWRKNKVVSFIDLIKDV